MGCTQSHDPRGGRGRGGRSSSPPTEAKALSRGGSMTSQHGSDGGRASPRPTSKSSPRTVSKASPRASPRPVGAAVQPQKKAKFPEVVGEVALSLEAPLHMPQVLKHELLREADALVGALGMTRDQFRAMVLDDYQFDVQAVQEDPVHFLLHLAAEEVPTHGRIDKAWVQRLLFTSALPPKQAVTVTGGFVEGTGNADHFIIGADHSAVVAGGSGRDVFMFLPRKDESGLRPHILTDFDPLEDLIDLRALSIDAYREMRITGYGHHHSQLTGSGLDVILIGVTPQQLEPSHFLFPTFSELSDEASPQAHASPQRTPVLCHIDTATLPIANVTAPTPTAGAPRSGDADGFLAAPLPYAAAGKALSEGSTPGQTSRPPSSTGLGLDGESEADRETVVSTAAGGVLTATYVFFQPPFEVTAKPGRLEVFVVLPLEAQVHIIHSFQPGGGTQNAVGDKIDLRGLHTIGMHKVTVRPIAEWRAATAGTHPALAQHGSLAAVDVGAVVTSGGGTVVLPGVAPEALSAANFIFMHAAKRKGSDEAPVAAMADCEAADAEPEPTLNADAFRSVVYWCMAAQAKEAGITPGSSPRPVECRNSPRPSALLETARHSAAPPEWLDLDKLAAAGDAMSTGSPTSRSSATAHGDWLRKVQRAPEGRRVKKDIDRIMRMAYSNMFDVTYGKVFVQINSSTLFNVRPRQVPHLAFNPHAAALLPPQVPHPDGRPRYTIALDLDETLVYSRQLHQSHQLCVRHGVHDLMVLLKQHNCEVVMWSAADAETVNAVWTAVDPTGITSHVLPGEAWQRDKHEQCKDVGRLGRDLRYVLIIDNTPLAVANSLDNAVVVRDYLGGEHPSDKKDELYRLMRILKQLFARQAEVPQFLRSCPELAQAAVRRNHSEILFNYMHHLQLHPPAG